MGYADDVNIMGRSIQKVKEGIETLENAGKEVGLKINGDKTKLLILTRKTEEKLM